MTDIHARTGSTRRKPPRGKFIVFEGNDGAGSTSQLHNLAAWLRDREFPVQLTKEPSNGPVGSALRQAIEGRVELDPVAWALAFAADRSDHISNQYNGVNRSLERGEWILCDRYLLSAFAYQTNEQVDEEWISTINRYAIPPDVTIYVDTPPATCFQRLSARSSQEERFHVLEELERTALNYSAMAKRHGREVGHLVWVDGSKSQEDVFDDIVSELVAWSGGSLDSGNEPDANTVF